MQNSSKGETKEQNIKDIRRTKNKMAETNPTVSITFNVNSVTTHVKGRNCHTG